MKFLVVALVLLASGSFAADYPTFQSGRVALLNGGYASYGTGRSTSGSSYAVQSAPAVQRVAYAVQAAPAVQHVAYAVQAAPAVQRVAYVQAAPAVQHVALVQAAPAVQHVAVQAKASRGPYLAAVQSTHNVQVYDVPSTGHAEASSIVIPPSVQPLDVEFQSQSSPLRVTQSHVAGTPAETQVASHEEEPDVLRQNIVKPVVHEVNEVIQPYRRVTQEVKPVLEEVNQVVAQGQRQQVVQAQRVAVQAAPAVQTIAVQAAPAVQRVAVQAAPAVQTVTLAAAPSTGYSTGYATGLSGLTGISGLSGYTSGSAQQFVLVPSGSSDYSSGQTFILANGGNTGYSTGSRSHYVRK